MPGDPVNNLSDLLAACGLTGELTLPEAVTLGGLDAIIEQEGRPKALSFKGPRRRQARPAAKARQRVLEGKGEGRLTDAALKSGPMDASAVPTAPPAAEAVDVSDAPAAPAPAPTPGQYRWLVDISSWEPPPAEWNLLLKALPQADSEKVMKFRFVADQKRALVSRYLQRRACFEATGVPWSKVEITRTKGGKPFMSNKPSPTLPNGVHANWNFNVSHEGKFVAWRRSRGWYVVLMWPRRRRRGRVQRSGIDDTLSMMKQQLSDAEWRTIHKESDSQKREDVFRKFWSLKEAYTKGRGDGLGFEFNRCDFKLSDTMIEGTSKQPVQKAALAVDGKALPSWGFYIQVRTRGEAARSSTHSSTPLSSQPPLLSLSRACAVTRGGSWISSARGPPSDVVDAHGNFRNTLADVPNNVVGEQLALAEPPFVYKTLADLVSDEMKVEYAKVKGLEPDEVMRAVKAGMRPQA